MKWIVGSSIHGRCLGHYEQDNQEIVRRVLETRRSVLLIALHGAEPRRACVEQLAAYSYRVSLLDGQTTENSDAPCDEIVAWSLMKGGA